MSTPVRARSSNSAAARDRLVASAREYRLIAEGAAGTPPSPTPPKRLLPDDSAARKTFPMGTGLLDYFPDALAAVAEISYRGNQKHNPGEPLHWARGKSMDHADCIVRHFIERGGSDGSGSRHSAQLAWRALALLQEELEVAGLASKPRGATDLPPR